MRLSVVVPVYNEEKTVLDVVSAVKNCGCQDLQVVIVNDASTDGTRDKLDTMEPSSDLVIVHHEKNQGKTGAIRTSAQYVDGEAVVVQDADLEYSPDELPKLLLFIENNLADAVYGSRYSGRELLVDSFWHYAVNRFLTTFSNMLSNLHLTDMETCYKMMRANIFRELDLKSSGFGLEPEITAKLAKRKVRIYEVPISYRARRFDEGKKIGWKDGVAALWYIIRFNLFK